MLVPLINIQLKMKSKDINGILLKAWKVGGHDCASGIDFAYFYDFFRVDFGTVPTMWFYFSLQYRI